MFTRDNTKQMKGIAILLMLAHHLFSFPDRIPYGITSVSGLLISGKELSTILGSFGKICVSIFMFLGGYGLYVSSVSKNQEKSLIINNLYLRIMHLYKKYWKVFLVFIPMGFLLFSNYDQWCTVEFHTRFSEFNLKIFISNFIGYSSSYNGEWWFFKTYLFALFEGYIFIEILKNKKSPYIEVLSVILWHILITAVFPQIISLDLWGKLGTDIWFRNMFMINDYSSGLFVGIIFAKYKIFHTWEEVIDALRRGEKILFTIIIILLCVYIRVFVVPTTFDMLIVPVFILAVKILVDNISFLSKPLKIIGNNSTNMWLIHSFFCYYFYPVVKIVYFSNNKIIIYFTLLGITLLASVLLDKLWKFIGMFYGFVFRRKNI